MEQGRSYGSGETARDLVLALHRADLGTARRLIDSGLSPGDALAEAGDQPYGVRGILAQCRANVLELLAGHGVDLARLVPPGSTPVSVFIQEAVHTPAAFGFPRASDDELRAGLRCLSDLGFDLDAPGGDGMTPLCAAAGQDTEESRAVAAALIAVGAGMSDHAGMRMPPAESARVRAMIESDDVDELGAYLDPHLCSNDPHVRRQAATLTSHWIAMARYFRARRVMSYLNNAKAGL